MEEIKKIEAIEAVEAVKEIRTVGLIINRDKAQVIAIGQQLVRLLDSQRVTAVAIGAEAEALQLPPVTEEEFCAMAQLVLVIGGDGTMLRAARTVYGGGIPILGINQGYLGFLTEIEVEQLTDGLRELLAGRYQVEHRMMLTAQVYRDGCCIADVSALNDLVVTKGALSRIIKMELYLQEQLVERYHGDGLIFSTPTGSTGYSLSAGGPIVYPALDLCVVAPICPHSLIARPLIFSPEHTLTVRLDANNAPAMLTVDGQNGVELKQGDRIQISKAQHDTRLIVLEKRNFFAVLREKLKGVQE